MKTVKLFTGILMLALGCFLVSKAALPLGEEWTKADEHLIHVATLVMTYILWWAGIAILLPDYIRELGREGGLLLFLIGIGATIAIGLACYIWISPITAAIVGPGVGVVVAHIEFILFGIAYYLCVKHPPSRLDEWDY